MKLRPAYRRCVGVWLALITLLAITTSSAYIPMGIWNGVANFSIAAVKVLLVAYFFMHLHADRPVLRIVAIAGLFTLALLLGLTASDYAARVRYPAPWQAPQGALPASPCSLAVLSGASACRFARGRRASCGAFVSDRFARGR
jgi:caa(3)-type oxidase subunit IV